MTHVIRNWNGEIMTHNMESNANDLAHLRMVKKRLLKKKNQLNWSHKKSNHL